jgi:hypothetical protein
VGLSQHYLLMMFPVRSCRFPLACVLRHFYASSCIKSASGRRAGFAAQGVQERLGHSSHHHDQNIATRRQRCRASAMDD